jgi:hypothetical protein
MNAMAVRMLLLLGYVLLHVMKGLEFEVVMGLHIVLQAHLHLADL